jgi:hypothetical protein
MCILVMSILTISWRIYDKQQDESEAQELR